MGFPGQLDQYQAALNAKAYLFAGIFLMGLSSAVWFYAYRHLRKLGVKNLVSFQVLPAYREYRTKQGWPWWPEYLCWALRILSVLLLIKGLFLLNRQ
jgi:hypothetical protein